MEKTIFTQPEVGKFFNEKFVNLQMGCRAPENVEIAKKYKVEAFPTLGIIAPERQGYPDQRRLHEGRRAARDG